MQFKNWKKTYKPLVETSSMGNEYCTAFESYGEEWEFVKKQNPLCIWTVVEWTKTTCRIVGGARISNRIFYYITEIPHKEGEYVEAFYGA